MIRTRRNKSDTIAVILDKIIKQNIIELPEAFHANVIKRAQEQLRVLNTKCPPNVPLCSGDTLAARSAVILEFTLRKGIPIQDSAPGSSMGDSSMFEVDVPLEVLGREVGCQKRAIEGLARVLRGHLQGQNKRNTRSSSGTNIGGTTNKSSSRIKKLLGLNKSKNKSNESKVVAKKVSNGKPSTPLKKQLEAARAKRVMTRQSARIRANKNTRESGSKSKNTITSIRKSPCTKNGDKVENLQRIAPVEAISLHELTMKLQSKILDPDACEKKAKKIFSQLVNFKLSDGEAKGYNSKRHVRNDLEENLLLYEGCCLFIASKEMEVGRVGLKDIEGKQSRPVGLNVARNGKKRSRPMKIPSSNPDEEDEEDNTDMMTVEDIARVLRETVPTVTRFLEDILPIVERMRVILAEKEKQSTLSKLKNRNEEAGSDISCSNHDSKDAVVLVPISPPRNREMLYDNKKEYEAWYNALVKRMKLPGETTEDLINRKVSEILKRYED